MMNKLGSKILAEVISGQLKYISKSVLFKEAAAR